MAAASPPLSARGLRGWLLRVRAPFLTASIIPIVLGGVAAWARTGVFHVGYFLLTLVGGTLMQAGANMINDYFDHLSGTDRMNREAVRPFTGGSPVLRLGLLSPERVRNEALLYFAIAALIGFYLTAVRSVWILALGAAGVGTGIFYTGLLAPGGWGELGLFASFGPLMVLGSWVVQTGALAWEPVWASLPVAFLILNVLWINQVPDAPSDEQVGKRHWVVRLGRRRAVALFGAFFAAAYLSLGMAVLLGVLPVWTLLGVLPAPLAWRAWQMARRSYDRSPALAPANALTVQVHLLTGLFLIVGYLIAGIAG